MESATIMQPMPSAPAYDENDVHSAAVCTYKEGRGEFDRTDGVGCAAIIHTLKNRVGRPGFAHTLHDVIYGKNQFTSMSVPSDPEFNLVIPEGDPMFAKILGMAEEILNGNPEDVTKGAHYYANMHNVTSGWFYRNIVQNPQHPITVQIGRHTFFQ